MSKKREEIDFNAYNLRPAGSYLDGIADSINDFSELLKAMNMADDAAKQMLEETAEKKNPMLEKTAPKTQAEESEDTPDLDELLAELDALVGLDKIKADVKSLINLVKIRKLREEYGLASPAMSLHLVFMGNPGTGKTTVARLVAQLYRAIGVLSKGQLIEVDRSGLVAGYVGQTAIKTGEVIQKALGGVLFIDEAYALATRSDGQQADFGQEAIDTILKAMEDNRRDFVVIVAGYEELMERFISSNPGLESRFNKYFLFDDYTGEELYKIFLSFCKKNEYALEEAAEQAAEAHFKMLYETRDENFGNARDVRNLFEKVVSAHADRVAALEAPEKDDLITVLAEDFEKATLM